MVGCESEFLTLARIAVLTILQVPDLGGGSIIGNAAERGVGYTPYGVSSPTRIRSQTGLTR